MFVPYRPPDRRSYSYLLGLYLGDGYVDAWRGRSLQLVIACDAGYPELIEDCWAAMQLASPGCHIGTYKTLGCIRVVGGSQLWLEVFPQHGPGRKHDRPIALEPWQREITDVIPQEFVRGPFCEYCDKLGIRWTQSNDRNISVSHRHSVAALDEFIGPKR